MTKRQMVAECTRLAADFSLRFERPSGVDTVIASATTPEGPLAIAMAVAGIGRAAVETRVLGVALNRLQQTKA